MPIPDMPIRDIVNQMYRDPEGLEVLVTARREALAGEGVDWQPLSKDGTVKGEDDFVDYPEQEPEDPEDG